MSGPASAPEMDVRNPAVAGTFYPSGAAELSAAVDASYTHRLGPGALPSVGGTFKGLKACVCPHAGYAYSGPVAAHSYLDVSRMARPALVVILGPNHYGLGAGVASYGQGVWETPLGRVEVDAAATAELEGLSGVVEVDREAHRREHSIEVQLPFLQRLYGRFTLLPVSLALQDKSTARSLGKALAEMLRPAADGETDAVLVASSDLTHYEPASRARDKDLALLRHVEALDVDSFYSTLGRMEITACGYGAIASVMEACRIMGMRGRVNAYHNSGEVTGDYEAVVGYPSVSFA